MAKSFTGFRENFMGLMNLPGISKSVRLDLPMPHICKERCLEIAMALQETLRWTCPCF